MPMQKRLQELGIEPLAPGQDSVTDAFVQTVERKLGVILPQDYRLFLQRHGVCASTHELIYHVKDDWLGGTDIFFGADTSGVYDLLENLEAYAGRVPPTLLPIGTDPGGDLLCLGIRGAALGKVYFWDQENEGVAGQPWWDNVYPVANSLAEFFASLEIEPESD